MNNPNSTGEAVATTSNAQLDNEILSIMTQMTSGNQTTGESDSVDTGMSAEADTDSPVAPDSNVEPEDSETEEQDSDGTDEEEAPEEVSKSKSDSTDDELIDFIAFTTENPNAKFKFTRNGKDVVIDAKKAASILGQGSAIHEEARELKVEKAEFEEYVAETRARQEGLTLAMEFTIEPRLRGAYDEIIKVQGWQSTFQEQLKQVNDPVEIARIQSAMEQNQQYLRGQADLINQLKPAVEQYKTQRKQQVNDVIEHNRKSFKDKELRNKFVFDEIRGKLQKEWTEASGQLVTGIDNIDLVTSDEHILGLIRDGMKYRDRPKAKSNGGTASNMSNRKSSQSGQPSTSAYNKLREQAKAGNKTAQDDLILMTINAQLGGKK